MAPPTHHPTAHLPTERPAPPRGGSAAEPPAGAAAPEGLLDEWLSRADLAKELGLSIDTLQRWETRRIGPPCVRVGRKVLYRKDAVRAWLREQEDRKASARGRA